jgi:hypothetical protein
VLVKSLLASAALLSLLAVAPAESDFDLEIEKKVTLLSGGEQAVVEVTAVCPVGERILEAFVYINQGGFSTQFGFFTVPCDGEEHERTVTVTALDFTLERGKASVSGFLLLANENADSISPVQKVRLR